MAAGTLAHLRRGERDGWVLAVFLLGKLAYEHWGGRCRSRGATRWSSMRTSTASSGASRWRHS